MSKIKLTTADLRLLEVMRTYTDEPNGFVPRFDQAHPRNQERLHAMRAAGLVHYTWRNPIITITPAGRSALQTGGKEHG